MKSLQENYILSYVNPSTLLTGNV